MFVSNASNLHPAGMQTNAAGSAPSLPCRVDCLYLTRDEAPMNVQLPAHMDKPSFLAWLQGREGRYELVNGRVVMMVNATRAHGMIVSNLVVLLRNQLDPKIWTRHCRFRPRCRLEDIAFSRRRRGSRRRQAYRPHRHCAISAD
jgi:hypothetical protein